MENEEAVKKELDRAEKHLNSFKLSAEMGLMSSYHKTGYEYSKERLENMTLTDDEKTRLFEMGKTYNEATDKYKKKKKKLLISSGIFLAAAAGLVTGICLYNIGLPNGASFNSEDNSINITSDSYSCVKIPRYYHFKKIRKVTFYNSPVQKAVIPSSVDEVYFESCYDLKSFDFTKTAKGAQEFYFRGCGNLTSVVLSDKMTEIPDYAFSGTGITSFEVPEGTTEIGKYAFSGTPLESITIPNTVTSIGEDAFYKCASLTTVTIPSSVTSIGEEAFYASGLTSMNVPGTVKEIGTHAFAGCENLSSFTLNEGTEVLGDNIITGTASEVYLPSTITSMGRISKYYETNLVLSSYNGLKYAGTKDNPYFCLVYAETTDEEPSAYEIHEDCKVIAAEAFSKSGISSITIPSSVISIGDKAFAYCNGLSTLTIPAGVSHIGVGITVSCKNLWSITVDSANTTYASLDKNVIYDTASKTVLAGCNKSVIPSDAEVIEDYALCGFTWFTEVIIPSAVRKIGDDAFASTGIKSVTLNGNVEVGKCAFAYCESLTKLEVDAESCAFDWFAFTDCTSLSSVKLSGIKDFGYHPFDGDTALKAITFNGTIKEFQNTKKNGLGRSLTVHCTDGDLEM